MSATTTTFGFDRVFGPASKQVDVHKAVVGPLIKQVLQVRINNKNEWLSGKRTLIHKHRLNNTQFHIFRGIIVLFLRMDKQEPVKHIQWKALEKYGEHGIMILMLE